VPAAKRALLAVGGACHDSTVDSVTAAAIDWLLRSDEPAIRLLVRRDVLGEPDLGERRREGAALTAEKSHFKAWLANQPG
jgi:hypothetical protein